MFNDVLKKSALAATYDVLIRRAATAPCRVNDAREIWQVPYLSANFSAIALVSPNALAYLSFARWHSSAAIANFAKFDKHLQKLRRTA